MVSDILNRYYNRFTLSQYTFFQIMEYLEEISSDEECFMNSPRDNMKLTTNPDAQTQSRDSLNSHIHHHDCVSKIPCVSTEDFNTVGSDAIVLINDVSRQTGSSESGAVQTMGDDSVQHSMKTEDRGPIAIASVSSFDGDTKESLSREAEDISSIDYIATATIVGNTAMNPSKEIDFMGSIESAPVWDKSFKVFNTLSEREPWPQVQSVVMWQKHPPKIPGSIENDIMISSDGDAVEKTSEGTVDESIENRFSLSIDRDATERSPEEARGTVSIGNDVVCAIDTNADEIASKEVDSSGSVVIGILRTINGNIVSNPSEESENTSVMDKNIDTVEDLTGKILLNEWRLACS